MQNITLMDLKYAGLILPSDRSGEQRVVCPLCSSKRKKRNAKDLSINFSKGTWFCHHCNSGGLLENNYRYRRPILKPKALTQTKLEQFFIKRGISKEVYNSQGIYQTENFIAFPYYEDKILINIKYRGPNKTFKVEKDCELILYGINNIEDNKPLVFVEGEIDYLSVLECGIKNVVSVPNGAQGKLKYLDNAGDKLNKCSFFILAVDNDKPGFILRDNLIKRFGEEKCKLVKWPEDCKDSNDVLLKYGKEKLSKIILKAEAKIYGTKTIKEEANNTIDFFENGYNNGLKTGWDKLDPYYSIFKGNIDVITGVPGSGKSAFVKSLILNLMYKEFKTLIYSPEGGDIREHILSLACQMYKASPDKRHPKAIKKKELITAMACLQDYIYFIDYNTDIDLSLDNIIELTKKKITADGIDGLVIDPWNQLQHLRPSNLSETEYVGECLTKLKRLAITRSIHVWIIVHPKKMDTISNTRSRNKNYDTVNIYDLYGSSNWANKADCILSLKKIEGFKTEVRLIKVKSHKIGRLGYTLLDFNTLYDGYS